MIYLSSADFFQKSTFQKKIQLDRAVDGAPSQILTLKFLTPQHPEVPPRAWP